MIQLPVIISISGAVISIISGFWTGLAGRPLSTVPFTIHKLTALATVIALGVALVSALKKIRPEAATIILSIATGLAALGLFVTGGVLSFDKTATRALAVVHGLLVIIACGSAVAALILCQVKKV